MWAIFRFQFRLLHKGIGSHLILLNSSQLLGGCFAIYLILSTYGVSSLKSHLNYSLLAFFIIFLFFTGLEPVEVVSIFRDAIVNANPKLIFKFFGNAPLFLQLSEDGLDGLRHGISQFLLLVFLVNAVAAKSRLDFLALIISGALILLLQSRTTWLAMALAAGLIVVHRYLFSIVSIRTVAIGMLSVSST